jgi:hypothetical protein
MIALPNGVRNIWVNPDRVLEVSPQNGESCKVVMHAGTEDYWYSIDLPAEIVCKKLIEWKMAMVLLSKGDSEAEAVALRMLAHLSDIDLTLEHK